MGEFFGVLARDQHAVDGISFGQATVHDAAASSAPCTTTSLANPGKAKASRLPDAPAPPTTAPDAQKAGGA